ncbi:L7Ae/L30e/S12e/Gadd45 family ribosomal protein [Oribacterium sp. P9]|uniref:L7Ae/L30e/S12e/Gadd45 family ribosomal protein n=1 Tax=unclassified Oribacterium TaxID=2629782 RepID=UPI002A784EA6|nr:ribosomal L7Ae/L30e/S12e/Gadd45 family protein [Oribacterium sp.]MDD6518762.1 ribosomal L7Ae/L30e/S12e/Gadd45 family protein [Oribacterium sp.]MDY2855084.1 ribosomal L7Ae/L30e/S12e/Gadd45 family protein [Oliverpabstia sp.]
MTDKIYGLLGLCQRAGKCKSGEFAVEKSIKSGKSFLVIIPEDASDNTKKKFKNMTTYRSVPYQELGTKETLGHQLGRSERSSISIEDQGFAQAMIKYIDGGNVNVR